MIQNIPKVLMRLQPTLLAAIVLLGYISCSVPVHAGLGVSSGTGVHAHSDANTGGGTLAVGDTLSSTKACASGYTRVSPNYCARSGAAVLPDSWSAAGCVQSTALVGVTDAKAVHLNILASVFTANAIALRSVILGVYGPTDTTCVTAIHSLQYRAREEVAAVSINLMNSSVALVVLTGTTGRTYFNPSTLCTSCVVSTSVIGYYD